MKCSRTIFWIHFIIVTISHVVILGILGGFLYLNANESVDIWEKFFDFGIVWFLVILGTNHIAHESSKCWLTTLENRYRIKESKPVVGSFTPRYYKTIWRSWIKILKLWEYNGRR